MYFPDYDSNGRMMLNERYKEIIKLDKMLCDAEIPHTMKRLCDGWQIIYPSNGENRVMDAIEYFGSYGNTEDLLEIMGLLTPDEEERDSVCGCLTAENVFKRIKEHWQNSH